MMHPMIFSREAAAVSAGVDLMTYNMLVDLQHRDITPEDYDTLRRLDSSVQPKTLTSERLEELCPTWTMPNTGTESSSGPVTRAAAAHSCTSPAACEFCCICLEHIGSGERVRRLPCHHLFHGACIVRRLASNASTPPVRSTAKERMPP